MKQMGIGKNGEGSVVEFRNVDGCFEEVFYDSLVLIKPLQILFERFLHPFLPEYFSRLCAFSVQFFFSPSGWRNHRAVGFVFSRFQETEQ